jgi:hypothetical protein
MLERLGNVLYWTCCIFAGLSVAAGLAILFGTEPAFAIAFEVGALLIYGVGRAVRYVLVGR